MVPHELQGDEKLTNGTRRKKTVSPESPCLSCPGYPTSQWAAPVGLIAMVTLGSLLAEGPHLSLSLYCKGRLMCGCVGVCVWGGVEGGVE